MTSDLVTLGSALGAIGAVLTIARGARKDAAQAAQVLITPIAKEVEALKQEVKEMQNEQVKIRIHCAEKHNA